MSSRLEGSRGLLGKLPQPFGLLFGFTRYLPRVCSLLAELGGMAPLLSLLGEHVHCVLELGRLLVFCTVVLAVGHF